MAGSRSSSRRYERAQAHGDPRGGGAGPRRSGCAVANLSQQAGPPRRAFCHRRNHRHRRKASQPEASGASRAAGDRREPPGRRFDHRSRGRRQGGAGRVHDVSYDVLDDRDPAAHEEAASVRSEQLPYDPFRSFVHVAQIAYIQFVLAVNPSVPAANVAELIALARARPGRLTYARGSEAGHITAEMFKAATGTDIVHVPYKGSALATTDLLSGHVDMMFTAIAGIVPYFTAKRLRTPAFAVKKLNEEIGAVLQMPDIVEKMLAQGAEPRHGTPEQFTALLRTDWEKQRGVLQRIGFKPE